jgi:cytochrome c biogenesis protein
VQASVFQLTRAPGKKVVYLGSLLLVLGIFSMFYVRERRLWFWLKDTDRGTRVVMAMSSARKTLDFEKEFVQTRESVGVALGARLIEAADDTKAASASTKPGNGGAPSPSSQDSTR